MLWKGWVFEGKQVLQKMWSRDINACEKNDKVSQKKKKKNACEKRKIKTFYVKT
jgi:hypothetical protein